MMRLGIWGLGSFKACVDDKAWVQQEMDKTLTLHEELVLQLLFFFLLQIRLICLPRFRDRSQNVIALHVTMSRCTYLSFADANNSLMILRVHPLRHDRQRCLEPQTAARGAERTAGVVQSSVALLWATLHYEHDA
jgi:hypothetical protein